MAVSRFSKSNILGYLARSTTAWTPNANGGNITNAGGYRIHAFTSTGTDTFQIFDNVEIEYLVISGGGTAYRNFSQDSGYNAGGGAGGLITTSRSILAGSYSVTVGGAGGNSSLSNFASTTAGGNAWINDGGNSGSPQNYAGRDVYANSHGAGAGGPATSSGPGPGVDSTITGSSFTYGKGGQRFYSPVRPNTGDGGNGGNGGTGGGDPGATGVVIIRYAA